MQFTTKYYLPVPLFAFVAWILLLLATVSTPITKSIYIAQVSAKIDVGGVFNVAQASTSVRFGVYGWCISELKAEVAGGLLGHTEPAKCSPKKIGYEVNSEVLDRLNLDDLDDNVSTTLTFGLATHIVAAVLSFVALLASLFTLWRGSRITAGVTMIFMILALLFAIIAFAFDIAFATIARHVLRAGPAEDWITVKIGNATWMTLVAMILLLVTSFMSCIGCVRVGRAGRSYDEKTPRY